MRLFLGLLISLFPFLGPSSAWAQEDEYDIPPPPPIMDDYEEPYIEEVPPDADITGPVYDSIPPADDDSGVTNLPDDQDRSQGPGPNAPRAFGFTRPNLGRPTGGAAQGGGSFGQTKGDVKFHLEEGVFWEKGKKRGRTDGR